MECLREFEAERRVELAERVRRARGRLLSLPLGLGSLSIEFCILNLRALGSLQDMDRTASVVARPSKRSVAHRAKRHLPSPSPPSCVSPPPSASRAPPSAYSAPYRPPPLPS